MLYALGGTGFTFLMTALGASLVFFFPGEVKEQFQKVFFGFAAGVMLAASVWSLLLPAMELAQQNNVTGWIPAAGGFLLGGLFLLFMDDWILYIHRKIGRKKGIPDKWKRTAMLAFSVSLHNAPEGMAVGLAFAMAVQQGGDPDALASAAILALGVGIQNFPEGAAIALPLRQEGLSRGKAFAIGALSGAIEPAAGMLAVVLASVTQNILPWFLAFAAGAMIFVVTEELIPQANEENHSHLGTWGVMAGFLLMMVLDVALG